LRAKRAFDVIVSSIGLVLTSPLWLLAAIAIKATSRGPVFHRAQRVGRNGEPFTLYKFRSMKPAHQPGDIGLTLTNDPRITLVGSVLRLFKIDELPQLINVLRGDMSLVGPRPEDPRYVAAYSAEQRRVLGVRPGMTSPASVAYRNEAVLLQGLTESGAEGAEQVYLTEIMPAKLALELDYLDRRSFGLDLQVLFRTFGAVVRPPGLKHRPRRALGGRNGG
jgi:lipopolysaccharide/colanic/teichoic acid biosynthesis glycosyltransferase